MSRLRQSGEQAAPEAIFRQRTRSPGPRSRPARGCPKPTVSSAVSRLEQAGLVRVTSGIRPGGEGRKPLAFVVSDRAGYVDRRRHRGHEPPCGHLRPLRRADPCVGGSSSTTKDGTLGPLARRFSRWSARAIDRTGSDNGAAARARDLGPRRGGPQHRARHLPAHNVAPEGGFDPLAVIRGRFDLPALVENNVNLAAVGEKWFGPGPRRGARWCSSPSAPASAWGS